MQSVKRLLSYAAFVACVLLIVGFIHAERVEASHDEPFPFYVYDGPDGTIILCEAEHGDARCLVVKPIAPIVCNMDTQECRAPVAM